MGEALLQAWLLVCSLMALDQMEPPRVEEQKMGLEQMMVAGRDLCSAMTTQNIGSNVSKLRCHSRPHSTPIIQPMNKCHTS